MKKIALIIVLISNIVKAQCPVDLVLSSQSDVNDFPTDYPGCSNVDGYLRVVEYGSGITNIDSLYPIDSIAGKFEVKYCWGLSDLDGLDNLSFIGGDFIINQTTLLADFNPLSNLQEIGHGITITENEGLKSLNGLENITNLGDVSIQLNDSLNSLDGLNNLDSCGNFILASNPFIVSLAGIGSLQYTGDFELSYLHGLDDLTGINRLKSTGDFEVRDCNGLLSLNGVDSLETVGKQFYITDNEKLETLGAPRLSKVGTSFTISYHENLKDLKGPIKLDSVLDYISIKRNECDTLDLSGIGVKYCGSLEVESVTGVTYAGFDSLQTVAGDLTYTECIFSDTLNGLNSLESVESFYFGYNDSVKVLDIVKGSCDFDYLTINNNYKLRKVTGFSELNQLTSGLVMEFNPYLTSIEGVSGLQSIGGLFKLKSNRKLKSIEPLNSIDAQSLSTLSIQWADSIESCAIGFICDYLNEPSNTYYLNSSNGEGCITREEILAECILTSTNRVRSLNLNVYPNPSNGVFRIETITGESAPLVIYNSQMQLVKKLPSSNKFEIELEDNGLYFIHLVSDKYQAYDSVLVNK